MTYYAKLTRPNAGLPMDILNIKNSVLKPSVFYMVDKLEVGKYISYCSFKNESGIYNIAHFDFFDENMNPIDILRTELNK